MNWLYSLQIFPMDSLWIIFGQIIRGKCGEVYRGTEVENMNYKPTISRLISFFCFGTIFPNGRRYDIFSKFSGKNKLLIFNARAILFIFHTVDISCFIIDNCKKTFLKHHYAFNFIIFY